MENLEATREISTTFLGDLVNFYTNAVYTCWSLDADKLCMSTGFSCLYALLVLLSCFLLVYKRCTYRGENVGETVTSFYKCIGNLCSTVGAILSDQLYIMIFMGTFATAVDVVHIISYCFHLCMNSQAEKSRRKMKSRKRQLLFILCALLVVGGGPLKPWVVHHSEENSLNTRRLLQVNLQDSTETLGYSLGLLSFVISCTSRLPALSQAYRGQMLTRVYVSSWLLSVLAGAFYATAILLYNTQFMFVSKALPWLLSALCCVFLDLLILAFCWCKRGKRGRWQHNISPDAESLLGCPSLFNEDNSIMKKQRKQHICSSSQTKTKNVQKTTEMGHYMDVHPARNTSLQMLTLSKDEEEHQLLHGTVGVIRFDSFCSSDSLCDSSLESSDLEWDFEEANGQWNEPTAKQQEKMKFSLQEWHPKPYKSCICAMFGSLKKTLPDENDNK